MKIIKVLTNQNIKEVSELAHKIWNEYFISIITQEQIDYMLKNFQSENPITNQIQKEGYEYFLIKNDEQNNIGYFSIQKRPELLFLSKLYIDKSQRGKGTGKEALEFITNKAKDYGLSKIQLTCNKFNLQSLAIYERWGFDIVKSVETDIGNGFVMDDYILEKIV